MQYLGEKGMAHYTQIMKSIGETLAKKGWLGLFGIDFIYGLDEKKIYVVEINPRMQASTSFLHVLMEVNGQVGPGVYHAASLLGDKPIPIELVQNDMKELRGSHVLINNKTGSDVIVNGDVESGLYMVGQEDLTHHKTHYWQDPSEDQVLVTCGVPDKGARVENHGTILKVYSQMEALDKKNHMKLSPEMERVVRKVYTALDLKEV
jgi:hypothetical protein